MSTEVAAAFIPYGRHSLDEKDIEAVVDVLRQGPLTQGPRIEVFEKSVADYVGARYAVAVSNGTAALHLACLAAGLQAGDAALTSPNTFVATPNAIVYAGATPHLVDIGPQTLNLSPEGVAKALAQIPHVKAILPVHFAGWPCDMPALRQAIGKKKVVVIEDAAHALGATYPQGGRVGNCAWSDMTIFSFHPVKLIAAGEGGMITTNDTALYRRLLRLRSHGINKLDDALRNADLAITDGQSNPWYYEMQELGFNYRMTDIQAALATSQFSRIEVFLAQRRAIAETYDAAFAGLKALTIPQRDGRRYSAHHLYPVRIDFARLKTTRRQWMTELRALGIGTQVHYIPVYEHPFYKSFGFKKTDFPANEAYYAEAVSLPIFFDLSRADQERVIAAVKERVA